MNTFNKEHFNHIQSIFEEKTGTSLPSRQTTRRPVRAVLVLAAVLACLTMTTFAVSLFSGLEGDELALSSVYEGNGVVSVHIENRSDKPLTFQPTLKLMRWNTSEEIEPLSDGVTFSGREFAPHSGGTMTIDLSAAYDIAALEEPLAQGDHYYFVLTNNHFVFGQDWMCSVTFAEAEEPSADETSPVAEPLPAPDFSTAGIPEELQFYFEGDSADPAARRALNEAYAQACAGLFAAFDGTVVPSVSPVLPGNRISSDFPRLTVDLPADEQGIGIQWYSVDTNFKLLATEGEYAYVISALLPSAKYADAFTELPLFYILTYEKEAITEDAYAFIYGQLHSFADLAQYQVYEDERFVCYEVSPLLWSDLSAYGESIAVSTGSRWDRQVQEQVEAVYDHYKENLSDLISFR